MKPKPFKNHSIFDGIIEFDTDQGESVIAVLDGELWRIMLCDGSRTREPRHKLVSKVKVNGTVTPKKLWAAHKREVNNVTHKT